MQATTTGAGNTYGVNLSDVQVDSVTQLPTFSISEMGGGSQMWFSYGSTALDFTTMPAPMNTSLTSFNPKTAF